MESTRRIPYKDNPAFFEDIPLEKPLENDKEIELKNIASDSEEYFSAEDFSSDSEEFNDPWDG